jgi:hypothetical protein
MSSTIYEKTNLILPEGYFDKIEIQSQDAALDVSPRLLEKIWNVINHHLVEGEYRNLWMLLHKDETFYELCNQNAKALHYVMPALLERAADCDEARIFRPCKGSSCLSGCQREQFSATNSR